MPNPSEIKIKSLNHQNLQQPSTLLLLFKISVTFLKQNLEWKTTEHQKLETNFCQYVF